MATHWIIVLLIGLTSRVSAIDGSLENNDTLVAIEEMQRANYFTFVMLIKMLQDRTPANVTFLMPKDRMLSSITVPENGVLEFLLQHSIPLPLLFDHLQHFPTGSIIPTCKPNFFLKVLNNGRRSFYLNNVKIISPNICMAQSSIRCHGIGGVLGITEPENNRSIPSTPSFCLSPKTSPEPGAPSPIFPRPACPPNMTHEAPAPIKSNSTQHKSGSVALHSGGVLGTITSCVMLLLVAFQMQQNADI